MVTIVRNLCLVKRDLVATPVVTEGSTKVRLGIVNAIVKKGMAGKIVKLLCPAKLARMGHPV